MSEADGSQVISWEEAAIVECRAEHSGAVSKWWCALFGQDGAECALQTLSSQSQSHLGEVFLPRAAEPSKRVSQGPEGFVTESNFALVSCSVLCSVRGLLFVRMTVVDGDG